MERLGAAYLRSLEIAESVVLAILLVEASDSLLKSHDNLWAVLMNYRFVVQFLGVLVFLEFIYVFSQYHYKFKIDYRPDLLFADVLLIVIPTVLFMRIVGNSWKQDHPDDLRFAFLIFAFVFVAMFGRQWRNFRKLRKLSPPIDANERHRFVIPMVADWIAVFMCSATFLSLPTPWPTKYMTVEVWCLAGLVAFVLYFLTFRLYKLQLIPQK